MRGHIVTLTGQSGSGKTTISKRLQKELSWLFTEAISHTTRAMRDGELEGYDYFVIDDETFDLMESGGEFLETVKFCGRKYGSTYAEADKRTETGQNAFVILEPHGVEQWKLNYTAPMLHISVEAPSIDELAMRMKLQGRSEEDIQKRLAHDAPVFDVDPILYDIVVLNDNLERACQEILDFVSNATSTSKGRRILLTQEQVTFVDEEDFDRINQHKWCAVWSKKTQSYYAMRNLHRGNGKREKQYTHREVMRLKIGDPRQVDHINHDTLDNRKENLQLVDHRGNAENRRTQSEYGPGVQKRGKRFCSRVRFEGRLIHIGHFSTPEEAQRARRSFLERAIGDK